MPKLVEGLEGTTFYYSEILPVPKRLYGSLAGIAWAAVTEAMRVSITAAQKYGASVHLDTALPPIDSKLPENTFRLNAPEDLNQRLPVLYKQFLTPRPATMTFIDWFNGTGVLDDPSFVLADPKIGRGHAKYYIEKPEQVAILRRLGEKEPHLINNFEVRRMIESPGTHYSTVRVLVVPTGQIIGACLKYAAMPKENVRVVENDRIEQTSGVLYEIKDLLENPNSDYFLRSKDITNNRYGHGIDNAIALHGAPVSDNIERQLLIQHEINPDQPELPNELVRQARLIGADYGPYLDLVLGIDFIKSADDETWYVLEINTDPGEGPFRMAEVSRREMSIGEGHRQMRLAALGSIANACYSIYNE